MKKTLSKISYPTTLFIAFLMLVLSGCSAHSPMIVENTTNTKKISENTYPAHQNKIFLTKESLPTNTQIEILASIDIGKVWYGNSKEVYESMAIRAREV